MKNMNLLALDLEGTLISNGVSVFPRPGLYEFLEFCASSFEELVIFTALSSERARRITHLLAQEGEAPAWFAHLDVVEWQGPHKDLHFAGVECLDGVYLLDDHEDYVHPAQRDHWIRVVRFDAPYSLQDTELARLMGVIKEQFDQKKRC